MTKKEYMIPKGYDVVFVSDMFAEDYTGGAELTMEALIEASPFRVFKMHSHSVTPELVAKNTDKYWVLVNFSAVPQAGLIEIATSCKYSIVECDYKFCVYRSPQLHNIKDNEDCTCHERKIGKFIKGLFKRAQYVFFMSATHLQTYIDLFPEMNDWENLRVQYSTWSPAHLDSIRELRENSVKGNKWAVLGGGSWIKNQPYTENYCKENGMEYDVIGGLPYNQFIELLSTYKGLVFLPAGYDTCPRLVVEARLLGLETRVNDYVQHAEEEWFLRKPDELDEFLRQRPEDFWGVLNLTV